MVSRLMIFIDRFKKFKKYHLRIKNDLKLLPAIFNANTNQHKLEDRNNSLAQKAGVHWNGDRKM
jgi:hypothetical protein